MTLNRMLDRIEGLLENLSRCRATLPMTCGPRCLASAIISRGGAPSGPGSETLIPDAIRQLDEALALFAAILRVAEVESGDARRFFVSVDMTALLTELAESYAAAFDDDGTNPAMVCGAGTEGGR